MSNAIKTLIKLTAFIVVMASLSSCGFKLKGQYYLPDSLKTLYVTSEQRFNPLLKQLTLRLEQNKVDVIDVLTQDTAQLRLLPESFQRRTLSLFPNGQIAEYELLYFANFEVIIPNRPVERFSVELSREFQDDPNNALAKERERALILNELRVIASDRILAQLMMIE